MIKENIEKNFQVNEVKEQDFIYVSASLILGCDNSISAQETFLDTNVEHFSKWLEKHTQEYTGKDNYTILATNIHKFFTVSFHRPENPIHHQHNLTELFYSVTDFDDEEDIKLMFPSKEFFDNDLIAKHKPSILFSTFFNKEQYSIAKEDYKIQIESLFELAVDNIVQEYGITRPMFYFISGLREQSFKSKDVLLQAIEKIEIYKKETEQG